MVWHPVNKCTLFDPCVLSDLLKGLPWFPPSKSSSDQGKRNLRWIAAKQILDARRFAWHFVDVMESCLGTNRFEQSASDILKKGFLYWEHGGDCPSLAMSKEDVNWRADSTKMLLLKVCLSYKVEIMNQSKAKTLSVEVLKLQVLIIWEQVISISGGTPDCFIASSSLYISWIRGKRIFRYCYRATLWNFH